MTSTTSDTATPFTEFHEALSALRRDIARGFNDAIAGFILWRAKHPTKRTLRRQLIDAQGEALIYKIGFGIAKESADEEAGALQAIGQWYADLVKTDDLVQIAATQILNGTHPQRGIAAGALIQAGAECR